MLKYIFIRHGVTAGNMQNRYIGRTDEEITKDGTKKLQKAASNERFGRPDLVFVSPMKRCIQTAEIIYPGKPIHIVDDFRECSFGEFENKNYHELSDNPYYQKWVDSNGKTTFPSGENPFMFRERCCRAFAESVQEILNYIKQEEVGTENKENKENKKKREDCKNTNCTAAFVIHGGTIMSIFERYEVSGRDFYDWHIDNGSGYIAVDSGGGTFQMLKEIDEGEL